MSREQSRRDGENRRTSAEWITTAVSLTLILGLAGAILYEGLGHGTARPATLVTTVLSDDVETREGRHYLPIEVANIGDDAVEEVVVALEARDGETVVEEAESVIASLGENERTVVVFVLDGNPAGLTIDAGVVTFQVVEP